VAAHRGPRRAGAVAALGPWLGRSEIRAALERRERMRRRSASSRPGSARRLVPLTAAPPRAHLRGRGTARRCVWLHARGPDAGPGLQLMSRLPTSTRSRARHESCPTRMVCSGRGGGPCGAEPVETHGSRADPRVAPRVAGTSPSCRILHQHAEVHELLDVPQRRILRGLRHPRHVDVVSLSSSLPAGG